MKMLVVLTAVATSTTTSAYGAMVEGECSLTDGYTICLTDDNNPETNPKPPARTTASTLRDFCGGDTSYGTQPITYCNHYINGVLDASEQPVCLPPSGIGQTDLIRAAVYAWMNIHGDLSKMNAADAVRSALNDTFCKRAN